MKALMAERAAGARTQLTGVLGALAVALLVMVAPNLLRNLPTGALAAVVIASAIGLIEVTDLRRIYRIHRWEFWLSILCTVGVAVLGAIEGIGIAIVIAVIEFLWDAWPPYSAVSYCFAGMRRCFLPMPSCSITGCWTRSIHRRRPCSGSSSRRNPSLAWT
jgi:MFS superfamily sulfate permease-like transporter